MDSQGNWLAMGAVVGSKHCSEHCLFRTSVPNTVSEPHEGPPEPPPGPPEPPPGPPESPPGPSEPPQKAAPPWGAPYMYGSDGPGGGSGGPGGGSETVFGTDVRNRQCSEQCSEPTKEKAAKTSFDCFFSGFDHF